MPSFDVGFEVYCDDCGAGLCNQSRSVVTRSRGAFSVRVMPCEKCIKNAVGEAVDKALREQSAS